ncbi:MAG: helix-turn-helix transcriptional regulator [Bacteroidetes bacterium]|mgnify:CR=1 FL=1|nr:helix-turn-helix transcriptional regulator [Bacteroidota bacterium]
MNTKLARGLAFSIKNLDTLHDTKVILKRDKDENIILTCYYATSFCVFTNQENEQFYQISFVFPEHYLQPLLTNHPISYLTQFHGFAESEICCVKQLILHDIIHCKFEGIYLEMFLESKALELLLCFQKCTEAPVHDCGNCKFLMRPVEKNKILRAKEIILDRLDNPPTIQELSLEVGINQCYLKKGFKEMFDSTIYEFVQRQRILLAKLLLSTTDQSIAEIADQIGFSNTSNFSTTFKKITGVFPSELRKAVVSMN